jgi:type VI secretion system protein ImpA
LKLSKEALTKRGKDLQVAAWTTEALLRLEGFDGLRQGLELIRRLLDTYWDSIHPQIDEDGDLEMRAAPLSWAGSQLDSAIRSSPLTKAGHNWYQYKQSRAIPSEDAARSDPTKQMARDEAIGEGEIPPEEFDKGFESTPVAFCKQTYDTLAGLIEAVQALREYCDEKFGEAAPDFGQLRTSLEEVQQTARVLLKQKGGSDTPEPEEGGDAEAAGEEWREEETAAVAGAASNETMPAATAPRRRASSGGVEPSSHEDAIQRLLAAARYLRREDPRNAAGYLISRALRWGELRAAGANADATALAAPPSDLRISLKRLASEGAWDQVGDLAENAAGQPCGRAWLDLQRYACYACQFAGNDAVADAILAGLKSLLADVPQVLQWTLADDTPPANLETMAWLKERGVLPGDPAELAPAPVAPPVQQVWYAPPGALRAPAPSEEGAQEAPPDAYELAMQTAQAGNVEEALAILSREQAQEPCGRDRFLRKLQLAQLCLATGNEAIAEPVLQELAEEIDRRKLAEWELAEVVTQPLTLLYRCLDRAPEAAAEKRDLYARICRLYPARAVRLAR